MKYTATFIYGASGHGKVIIEILEANGMEIGGVFDDSMSVTTLLDYPVAGFDPLKVNGTAQLIISIGNNRVRKKIASELQVTFGKAIHPAANISPRCTIDEGTVVMAGVTVNSHVQIGRHVIINTNAVVDHDCLLEDYVHISPGVALAGNVQVREGTHVGIGATVIQGIKIGRWCTIGAGAVIRKDVPDYGVVVGNPGRIIKYNTQE
ncbi:acetyltransferase [Chitinophaga sp. MM2321]|uniref:acetyltransferase n=1 Tax=Chitinophaga sp. MM2321 TaxID=3137178 RepID=UPI0032D56CE3